MSKVKLLQSQHIQDWNKKQNGINIYATNVEIPLFNIKKYRGLTIKDNTNLFLLLLPYSEKIQIKLLKFDNKLKKHWFNIFLNFNAIHLVKKYYLTRIDTSSFQHAIIYKNDGSSLLYIGYRDHVTNKAHVVLFHVLKNAIFDIRYVTLPSKYNSYSPNKLIMYSFENKCHILIAPRRNRNKHRLIDGYLNEQHKFHKISSFYRYDLLTDIDIISFNNKLFALETRMLAGPACYYMFGLPANYLRLHSYNKQKNQWQHNSLLVNPINHTNFRHKYQCTVNVRGWIIVLNEEDREIWLISVDNESIGNIYIKSKISLPICGNYEIINLSNLINDELLIHGYIKQIIKKHVLTRQLSGYEIKLISSYYCNEQLYIICLQTPQCLSIVRSSNNNFSFNKPNKPIFHIDYLHKSWLIDADILFSK